MNLSKWKFISDGTWFDEGTEVKFICWSYEADTIKESAGLFEGLRNGNIDQESCPFDEFKIYDENGKEI